VNVSPIKAAYYRYAAFVWNGEKSYGKEDRKYASSGHEIKKLQIPLNIRRDEFVVREKDDKLMINEVQGVLSITNKNAPLTYNLMLGVHFIMP